MRIYYCIMTLQSNDPVDITGDMVAPNNVVAIETSPVRTVLTILEADPTNSGPYQCTAISQQDNAVATTSVDITIV